MSESDKLDQINSPEVTLNFQYTEADYVAAARLFIVRHNNGLFRLVLFLLYLLVAAVTLTILFADFHWSITLIGMLFFEALLVYNALVRAPRRYFQGDAKFRDPYQLTFADDGVGIKTRQIESKLAWSLFTKVIEGNDFYLLIYGKDLRMMTTVPKRAFQNQDQEKLFRHLISKHISEHSSFRSLKPQDQGETEYKPSSLEPPDWR